jgi:serine/threonine protein kinase
MNNNDTKRCPFCNEEINALAKKCKHCNEWLTAAPSVSLTGVDLVKQALGDRYEIQEEIGRGGMATVYKAVQKSLDRTVALKVVHQNLLHDNEFVARFHREAKLCASLSHPNIVTVHDEGEVSGVHFMAMEYLEGQDLRHLIRSRGRLTPEQTLHYLLPVAEALDYAHSRGLIHRDIKSANIFICNNPATERRGLSGAERGLSGVEGRQSARIVLMDFGIAHAAAGTQLTKAGTVIGTPEYMSPEQADGRQVDHRTDLYSLGVVMYECLTGRVPFTSDNAVSTIYKVLNEQPDQAAFGNITYRVKVLAMSLLSKNPDHRPASGAKTAEAIRQLQQGKAWQPPTPVQAAPKPAAAPGETIKLSGNITGESTMFHLTGKNEYPSEIKVERPEVELTENPTISFSKVSPHSSAYYSMFIMNNQTKKQKQPKHFLLVPAAFTFIIVLWVQVYKNFLFLQIFFIDPYIIHSTFIHLFFTMVAMFFASLITSIILRYITFFK